MMKFSQALTFAAFLANSSDAKKGKMFEANAFVTPKRATEERQDPYLKKKETPLSFEDYGEDSHANDIEDPDTHIISTSDIDNYFNLQVTTQLYFGSEQQPHDLILDTGSAVSTNHLLTKQLDFIVDLVVNQGLLELWIA